MKTLTSLLRLLRLLHLADTALPIGSAAHSFGLETLADADVLAPATLVEFLRGYLVENGRLEASFCRRGFALAAGPVEPGGGAAAVASWLALNRELSALKSARESRDASLRLGSRLLHLVVDLERDGWLAELLEAAERSSAGVHHACAFGLVGGQLGVDVELVTAAFLRQSIAGLVAACQKFLPLGQSQATAIQWQLYSLIDALAREQAADELATTFTPLLEIGSMRHPYLPVRLFIS
jgi:urease accessory protein